MRPDYDALRDHAERVRQAQKELTGQRHEMAEAIRAALALGAPAVDVARAAGVTRARVYQIRDGKR